MFKNILLVLILAFITVSITGCGGSSKTLPKKCGDKKWDGYQWYKK